MELLLLLALIVAGYYMYRENNKERQKNWVVFYDESHDLQKIQSSFAILKGRGVNCRLKSSTGQNIWKATAVLLVHKKDLERARKFLAEDKSQQV